MNFWNSAPFVRLLIPFILGIITSVHFYVYLRWITILVLAVTIIVATMALFPKLKISFKFKWLYGSLVFMLTFLLAYQLTAIKTEINSANHYSNYAKSNTYALCKIIEPIEEKQKYFKTIVEVKTVFAGKNIVNTIGRAIIYIEKNINSNKLNYGDEIIIKSNFKELPIPQNPGQFDYKKYLSFHNIYEKQYLNSRNWINTGINSGNKIVSFSQNIKNKLLNVLKKYHIKGDEYAVCSALLLGYEDKLNADIIAAYANTGALHVLSVSGMHVALIYIAIGWLLFFFDKIKNGLWIKSFLILSFLWFYAILTGLSPSVLRAATMFSFIILARTFNHKTNIYNTLAVSAFFLLLINPFIIMEVGFQLSYLAVLGIVFLQPKIYHWFVFENQIINAIWKISSVSIAAQVATFPLGLHYFHQFPNYFLFSNLFVIPLSTIIIYLGIALFLSSPFQPFAEFIAFILQKLIWFLNYMVKKIDNIPYALIEGVSITVFETWLIFGVIVSFIFYLLNKKYKLLFLSLLFLSILLIFQVVEQVYQNKQQSMIVYNVPKVKAIDFICSKNNYFISDSIFYNNENNLLFYVKHNWWDRGIKNTINVDKDFKNEFIIINNNTILFANKKIKIIESINDIESSSIEKQFVDYIVISKNAKVSIEKIAENYDFQKIIFDSSNSKRKLENWMGECITNNLDFYSVIHSGAFVIDFN